MKALDLRALPEDELVKQLGQARQELFNLRFQHATGELESTARIKAAKRNYACALTVARERNIDVN